MKKKKKKKKKFPPINVKPALFGIVLEQKDLI